MSKYFYKGATLNLVFATPVPDTGNRKTITGYALSATVQGLSPAIEVLDEYSFRVFINEANSLKLTATDVPVIVWARKDGHTLIGRNTDLQCIDPKFGLPNEALDDPSNMSLIFSEGGDLSFEFNYTTMPLSPYLMWLEDNPEGTQEEFLASFLNPKHDRIAPEYSDSPGARGELAMDEDYLYVCYADNTWGTIDIAKDVLSATPTTAAPETTTEQP